MSDRLADIKYWYEKEGSVNPGDVHWLIETIEKSNSQVSELVCAIYEHANEGTALMELAERIDSE